MYLGFERAVRELQIAGAENAIGAPVDAEFGLQCGTHVDVAVTTGKPRMKKDRTLAEVP